MTELVVIHSGGLDSTVLLAHLQAEGYRVRALSIDYGQRHRKELVAAARLCRALKVEHTVADLSALRPLLKGSSQTDDSVPVPHGHYEDATMRATVVPNRNMLMLAVALAHAIATGARGVAYGAHAGDHAVYPDCREAFASAMHTAALLCDYDEREVWRPFVLWTKADIARRGHELIPDLLPMTWSCYEGGVLHCGACGTCVERREAFALAGVPDLTLYARTPEA